MREKHTHKLRRHTYKSGNAVYFCMLPDCSYKIVPALAIGKRTVCHRCGTEFLMNEYSIRLAKPHCPDCHKPKVGIELATDDTPIPVIPEGEPFRVPVHSLRDRMQAAIMGKPDDEGEI